MLVINHILFQHFHQVKLTKIGGNQWRGAEFNIHWTDGTYTGCTPGDTGRLKADNTYEYDCNALVA